MSFLKSCPFCNCSGVITVHPEVTDDCPGGFPHLDTFYAHCDVCGCDGPAGESYDEAVEAWNDRGLLTEQYWCGCVRHSKWNRCDAHKSLEHDDEPPRQKPYKETHD